MTLELLSSHPRGWANPINVRPSAPLLAAPAWDAAPVVSFCSGAKALMLVFTYTRGGAGGAFDWQLQLSPYAVAADVLGFAQEWATESLLSTGVVVPGADTRNAVSREFQTYQATGAAVEAFVYGPVELGGLAERFRVVCRESGVVAPGTLQVTARLV